MPFFRFPLNRGKAFIRHYASSSEKSPVFAPVKITIAFARLFLLRSTTNFFRLSVFRFAQNANAQNFRLQKKKSFELLFFMFDISYAPDGAFFICDKKVRRSDSSEKSHVVAPVKITIAIARLFLLRFTTNFFR